jgi:hypothetical protein
MTDACPVCLSKVPLASLCTTSTRHACTHSICMQCAMQIADIDPVCPLCRAPFTTIIQNSNNSVIEYHVESNSLLPGLMNNSAFVMGIANNLIFEHDGYGGYEVHMPEFMKNVKGCESLFALWETHDDNPRREQIFGEMEHAVDEVGNFPMIFSRVVIGRYVEKLVREGFFIKTIFCPCEGCVVERAGDLGPDDIPEDAGGYKWLMMSREATPFGHWQSRDFLETA